MVNMGNVWDRTTEFLGENLGAILPLAAIAIFVPQSISGGMKLAGTGMSPAAAQGIALAMLLPTLWGQLVVTALALDPADGRPAAQTVATRRFGQALLATLILFVVIVLSFVPVLAALVASGVDLRALTSPTPGVQPDISGGVAAFVGLYGVAWLVFAAFVSVRFSLLLFPVVAAEGGVIGALRRAFALSNGIAWKLFGVALLFGLVMAIAWMAVTSVFGFLLGMVSGGGAFGIGSVVVALLGALVTTAYYVLQAAFMAKVYRAATSEREGV
jgi:hypothetical protein